MFGKGIFTTGDLLDIAANLDIINKSGAWYAYNDEKIGQGRENARQYLEDNPEVLAFIIPVFVSTLSTQLKARRDSIFFSNHVQAI